MPSLVTQRRHGSPLSLWPVVSTASPSPTESTCQAQPLPRRGPALLGAYGALQTGHALQCLPHGRERDDRASNHFDLSLIQSKHRPPHRRGIFSTAASNRPDAVAVLLDGGGSLDSNTTAPSPGRSHHPHRHSRHTEYDRRPRPENFAAVLNASILPTTLPAPTTLGLQCRPDMNSCSRPAKRRRSRKITATRHRFLPHLAANRTQSVQGTFRP